jgi:peptidoglycan hydrolase-like protein with peptidoglycan-binding domain
MAGMSSENITEAQEALRARGFNPGSTSGTMDAKTQQAVREFQKVNKLPVTGVLDPKTAQQLGITLEREQGSLPQSAPGSTTQPGQERTMPPPIPAR